MTDHQFVAQLAYEILSETGKSSPEDVEKAMNYAFDLLDKAREVSWKRDEEAKVQRRSGVWQRPSETP